MRKTLKRVLIMMSLICAIGIGTTFAYLQFETNSITNTFTSNRTIRIELKEPTWDGYDFGSTLPDGSIPGTVTNPDYTGPTLGLIQAKDYLPGDLISKNPTIKNISEKDTAYVAFKLVFKDNAGNKITRTEFENTYGKLDISNQFEEVVNVDKSSLFIYNTTLAINSSAELFTKVTLNTDIALVNDKLPTFAIEATGYAVQGNIDAAIAKTELTNLAK